MDQPSTFMQGLLSSLYTLGCFFGCVGSISFSEKIGRKNPILIGTILISIGTVIQTAAYSPAQFIVGRIVAGMGTGLNTSVIPVWQAETLPAKKRERFGAIQYVLVCTGTTISYWMAYALSYCANSAFQWRFLVAAQLVFAVLIMCLGIYLVHTRNNCFGAKADGVQFHGCRNPLDGTLSTGRETRPCVH